MAPTSQQTGGKKSSCEAVDIIEARGMLDTMEVHSAFSAQKPIAPVRLPGMFADTAVFGQALRLDEDTVTIKNFLGRDGDFTLPAALACPHALQLELDDEMQAYADAYFHHYFLFEVPNLSSEHRKAERVLERTFKELQNYKDPLFFCTTIVPAKHDLAAIVDLFKPPITFEHLIAYRRLMSNGSKMVPLLTLDDAKKAFEAIVKPELTPLPNIGSQLATAVVKVERKQKRERDERERRDPPLYVRGIPIGLAARYSMQYPQLFPELAGRR